MSQLKYYDSGSGTWKVAVVGAQGPTGPTGLQGTTGATGSQGATGAAGADGVGYDGITTSTSLTGTAASKTFTVNKIGALAVGTRVRVASSTAPTTRWFEGPITSISTLSVTVVADVAGSSATAFTNGLVSVAGAWGAQGTTGTTGSQGTAGDPIIPVIAAKTSNYTVALGDASDLIPVNSASNVFISIPTHASVGFVQGTQISILRQGTGTVYIQAVTPGTTSVQGTPGLQLRAQYSAATAIKLGDNHWIVSGDLSA